MSEIPPSAAATVGSLDQLGRNARRLFSGSLLTSLLGLFSFAVTARILGAADFGALALIFTFCGALLRLCGFQSWQAIIHFAARYREAADPGALRELLRFGFLLDALACGAATLLALFGSTLAGSWLDWSPRVAAGVALYAWVLVVSIEGTPVGILRFYDRFGLLALQQVLAAVVKLVLVLGAAWYRPTFETFLWVWMAGHVAGYLLLNLFALSVLSQEGVRLSDRSRQRPIARGPVLRYLLNSSLDGALRVVREFDVQLVALWIDEAAAGILRVARQLATVAGRLVDAFYEAGYPELARLAAQQQWPAFRRFARRSALASSGLALLGLAAFLVLGRPALVLSFGADYEAAYPVTAILLLAMLLWGLIQPYSPALMSLGRSGRLLLCHALAAGCYLILLLWLVPAFAAEGAAIAMVGLYAVFGVSTYISYRWFTSRAEARQAVA